MRSGSRSRGRRRLRRVGPWLVALGVLILAAPAGWPGGAAAAEAPPKSEDCLACHADKDLKREKPARGKPASVFVDQALVKASAHASIECADCHVRVLAPHEGRLPRVRCESCHEGEGAVLGGGAHGGSRQGTGGRPIGCADCHGTHTVRPANALGTEACVTCHQKQVGLYRESVHGRSRQRGDQEAASCVSCHGKAHALLSRSDPGAATYHLNLPRTCAACHGDSELARRHGITVGNVYQLYMDSIHGRAMTKSGLLVAANCSDCHGAHEIRPKKDPSSRVFRGNVAQTCATCHAGIQREYVDSVHGRAVTAGNAVAPVCTDCHSAHQIQRVEGSPWQLEVIRECGTFHDESLKTYRDTFHGKVTTLGLARVAKCADCHGAHNIQPASDQRSKVSATNIVATCRQCHPAATAAFAQFHPHAEAGNRDRFPKLYWASLLMTGLLVGVFGFFGLHTVLWFPRSLVERLRHGRHGGSPGSGRRRRP